jgi:hypothetical protein
MKSFINTVIITSFLFLSTGSIAASPTEAFGGCLIDNLNGKERKKLAKWIFFAIAVHPEIKSYSKVTSNDITDSDKYIGGLITRLLADNCPNEMKAASKVDSQAIEKAFELVGQVAMRELMTNQAVTTTITSYVNYTDQEKINKILSE